MAIVNVNFCARNYRCLSTLGFVIRKCLKLYRGMVFVASDTDSVAREADEMDFTRNFTIFSRKKVLPLVPVCFSA